MKRPLLTEVHGPLRLVDPVTPCALKVRRWNRSRALGRASRIDHVARPVQGDGIKHIHNSLEKESGH
jgi:hypothetical protein